MLELVVSIENSELEDKRISIIKKNLEDQASLKYIEDDILSSLFNSTVNEILKNDILSPQKSFSSDLVTLQSSLCSPYMKMYAHHFSRDISFYLAFLWLLRFPVKMRNLLRLRK